MSSGMMKEVRIYVWRIRPALAPNPRAMASKEPWSEQKNPEVAARMARDGSCTVPQMQDVLTKELSVRKSAVPKWKAQCVEKIFELAKLSTQQATLPVVMAAAATLTPPIATPAPNPPPAHVVVATAIAAVAAAAAAAAAAVQAEDEADEALIAHVEQQRAIASAAELENGDELDSECGDEPVELEAVEVASEGSEDEDEGDAADESESEVASAAVLAALQQLVADAESDPDAAADAILATTSIWRCCDSGARSPAWKCGGCNLWTHRTCQRRACGADRANPLCKACFVEAVAAASKEGPRESRHGL